MHGYIISCNIQHGQTRKRISRENFMSKGKFSDASGLALGVYIMNTKTVVYRAFSKTEISKSSTWR